MMLLAMLLMLLVMLLTTHNQPGHQPCRLAAVELYKVMLTAAVAMLRHRRCSTDCQHANSQPPSKFQLAPTLLRNRKTA
jgi:hypothetical protein